MNMKNNSMPDRIPFKLLIFIFIFSGFTSFGKRQNIVETISDKIDFTSSKDSSNKNTIRLITWNIQNLSQSKNDEEIDFIVNVLKDYDIATIQEVVAKHPAGAQKVAQI